MTILGVLELVTVHGPQTAGDAALGAPGRRWEIRGPLVVGRSTTADLTVALPALSRRHLQLIEATGRVAARDLGSRNGSAVNGRPLGQEAVILADGDELVLAGSVAFRFIDPMATPIGPRIGKLTGVWIDPDTDVVWLDARPLEPPLSPRQLDLLRLLHDADGEVVSRDRIVEVVWADAVADGVSDEAVAALVKRLRQRLGAAGRGELIEMVRHRGLRLVDPGP
ncbi:MAG: winged helix-turn-helix domain-containing protein [Actinomycetota bacterium]